MVEGGFTALALNTGKNMSFAERRELIKEAGLAIMVNLYFGYEMLDNCLMYYDSGSRRQYVVGRLDNGKAFAAKCPNRVPIFKPVFS